MGTASAPAGQTGSAVTASDFTLSFNHARPCAWRVSARVFAWARVPRPGQPGRPIPCPPVPGGSPQPPPLPRRPRAGGGGAEAAPAASPGPSLRARPSGAGGGPRRPPRSPTAESRSPGTGSWAGLAWAGGEGEEAV